MAKPERMDFVQAASFPLVFLTAYHMLVAKAGVQAGETVLVLGAGSGVGVAAIQIAKAFGANVIATAGSDAKLRKAVELGADSVVNHNTQDIVQEAKKYTAGKGRGRRRRARGEGHVGAGASSRWRREVA